MNWLLGLIFLGRFVGAHDSIPREHDRPASEVLTHRGYELGLSPKEREVWSFVTADPRGRVAFAAIHQMAGWKTKFAPSRVRLLVRAINLKALDQTGSPLLIPERVADFVRAARPPARVAGPDVDHHVRRTLDWNLPFTTEDLRLSHNQYVRVGLPRDELIRAIRRLDVDGKVQRVHLRVMHYTATVDVRSNKRAHWYPRAGAASCEDEFLQE